MNGETGKVEDGVILLMEMIMSDKAQYAKAKKYINVTTHQRKDELSPIC